MRWNKSCYRMKRTGAKVWFCDLRRQHGMFGDNVSGELSVSRQQQHRSLRGR